MAALPAEIMGASMRLKTWATFGRPPEHAIAPQAVIGRAVYKDQSD